MLLGALGLLHIQPWYYSAFGRKSHKGQSHEIRVSFALLDVLIRKLTEKLLAQPFFEPCTLHLEDKSPSPQSVSRCSGEIALIQSQKDITPVI